MKLYNEKFVEILEEVFGYKIELKKEEDGEIKLKILDNRAEIPVFVKESKKYTLITNCESIETAQRIKALAEKILENERESLEAQLLKQARENFVNDVVHFRFENIDSMLSRSEILDFDFYVKRSAVIIEIQDMYLLFKGKNELILQHVKDELYKKVTEVFGNDKDIVSYIGNNRFVICKSEDKNIFEESKILCDSLKEHWGVKFKIAIGDEYDMPGIEGMAYSYRDAEKYIQAGKRYLSNEDVYSFKNVGVYLLFSTLPKFEREKILRYIQELVEYDSKNKAGLRIFLEKLFANNLVLNKTEEELEIPKNKGKSILNQIKEITGLDPTKFEDAIKLYSALKLLK